MNNKIHSVRNSLRKFNRWAGVLSADPYGLGLSLSQCGALVDLERFESLRPANLANLLKLDRSSVSRLISALEDKGLISISLSSEDGRSKTIALTKKGQKTLNEIHRISNNTVESVFHFLSDKDQEQVAAAFEKLSKAVEVAEKQKEKLKVGNLVES